MFAVLAIPALPLQAVARVGATGSIAAGSTGSAKSASEGSSLDVVDGLFRTTAKQAFWDERGGGPVSQRRKDRAPPDSDLPSGRATAPRSEIGESSTSRAGEGMAPEDSMDKSLAAVHRHDKTRMRDLMSVRRAALLKLDDTATAKEETGYNKMLPEALPGKQAGPACTVRQERGPSLVEHLNAAAQQAGVAPGMPIPQALARAPTLTIYTPDEAAEAHVEHLLLLAAQSVTPRVERTDSGLLTLDLRGRESAELALRQAQRSLAEQGLEVRVGVAATPELAALAARGRESFCRAVSRAGTLPKFLEKLPLEATGLLPETLQVLHLWGLRWAVELARLKRDDVAVRLGPDGVHCWEICHERTGRPLRVVETPPAYHERLELDYRVETLEPLLFLLRRLLESLVVQLKARLEAAATLHLELLLADKSSYERSFKLPEATAQLGLLERVLHQHLEQVKTSEAIVGLVLRLDTVARTVRQQGLFETTLRNPARFADTLDRLVGLVGSERVGRPVLEDTHRPDAFYLEPLPAVLEAAPVVLPRGRGLPLQRCRPSQEARVRTEMLEGESSEAPRRPVWLQSEVGEGPVIDTRGPYRLSGQWWEQKLRWAREEWDVQLSDGPLLRLARLRTGWQVEGRYG